MKFNNFEANLKWALEQKESAIRSGFYDRLFPGKYQFVDNDEHWARRGVDTLVDAGSCTLWIDEKIVRKRYSAFCLETWSCTARGREKDGWMRSSEADRLLYCFKTFAGFSCWWIDFKELQRWFWPRIQNFRLHVEVEQNQTASRLVPVILVVQNVRCKNYEISLR